MLRRSGLAGHPWARPLRACHSAPSTWPAEPEALAEALVQNAKAPDDGEGDSGALQGAEDGPPGEGGEALLQVKGDEPERAPASFLEDHQVGEELGDVARASLCAEPEDGGAQVGAVQHGGPGEGHPFGPEPIEDVEDGNGRGS